METPASMKWILLLFLCGLAHGQISAAPPLHPVFVDNNGQPLSGGKLYSYAAGTTSPLATFTDATGNFTNLNPIQLDSTGSPSNGTAPTQIWLSNLAYKFCAYDVSNVQQWCVDNITTPFSLLNLSNTWAQTQIMPQIFLTSLDNQITTGSSGNSTILDFPPSVGIVLHFPTITDTMVGRTTTDTLLNKNLTVPQINSVPINNSPGTYFNLPNASPSGTAINDLTILSGGTGTVVTAGVTRGVVGVCINNCGSTGSATIQASGAAFCNFDGATFAGDYVKISSTTNGACHDTGATTYPTGGQVIGKVTQAIGGVGAATLILYGGDIESFATVTATDGAVTFTAGAGAGTGPVIGCSGLSSNCLDRGGTFNVTTGTSPSTTAAIVTVNFAVVHTLTFCTFAPGSLTSVGAPVFETTSGSTAFVLNSTGSALTGSTTYSFIYNCNFLN